MDWNRNRAQNHIVGKRKILFENIFKSLKTIYYGEGGGEVGISAQLRSFYL